MFIDTHAHLYADQFKADQDAMIARALEAQVERLYLPNIDHTSIDGMLALEEKYPHNCFATMGLHPCSVGKDFEKELYVVETWLAKRSFKAIGEMGTDLHWDKTYFEQQKEAFIIQANWAKKYNLPLIIHCRKSTYETIALLKEVQDGTLRGIFHCFGGSWEEAQEIIKLGFLMGIGGVVTYKNSGLQNVLPKIDMQHLVLETDAPYLTPEPHRGKRNESSYIPIIAQRLADIKQIPLVEVMQKTTENALQLFEGGSK
jgi:TatD DNase family protein